MLLIHSTRGKSIPARVALISLAAIPLAGIRAQTTREINDLNWMEFRELVPVKIQTVLLPTGTLEPHGIMNSGADNTAPVAIARAIAPQVNALIAPVVSYGVTGNLDAYPGTFSISESSYRSYITDIVDGLASQGFRNVVILNGHGGVQTQVLNDVAEKIGRAHHVRTMVINWFGDTDLSQKIFGDSGGHAGLDETTLIQAIDPALVHQERYSDQLAVAYPAGKWFAYPFPSSIILAQPGHGYPRFDDAKAHQYFDAVVDSIASLIQSTITKWDQAGIFR